MRLEAIALALCVIASPAIPQEQRAGCGPLPGYLKFLQERFNEFRVLDLEIEGGKFVVTRSNEGTWTILKVEGQEAACIFAAGERSIVDRGI